MTPTGDSLWVLNSYSMLRMDDANGTGVYSDNIMEYTEVRTNVGNIPMYGAATDNVLVISGGNPYTVNTAQYGGLQIYLREPLNNTYTLLQTITSPSYTASLKSKQIKLDSSGLVMLVQGDEVGRKFQLVYTRATVNDDFVMVDVLDEGLVGSVGEWGLGYGDGGGLLVVPYSGA